MGKILIEENDIIISKDNVIMAIDAHPDIQAWDISTYHTILEHIYAAFENNLVWQCHAYADECLEEQKEIKRANEDIDFENVLQNMRDGYKGV